MGKKSNFHFEFRFATERTPDSPDPELLKMEAGLLQNGTFGNGNGTPTKWVFAEKFCRDRNGSGTRF